MSNAIKIGDAGVALIAKWLPGSEVVSYYKEGHDIDWRGLKIEAKATMRRSPSSKTAWEFTGLCKGDDVIAVMVSLEANIAWVKLCRDLKYGYYAKLKDSIRLEELSPVVQHVALLI
jgi:hypothetical protein